MHYVDEGPRGGAVVVMLHGEPSWSSLYRKRIPIVVAAGHRAIAPDRVGFGRCDKPVRREDDAPFLQEDRGEALARVVIDFMAATA